MYFFNEYAKRCVKRVKTDYELSRKTLSILVKFFKNKKKFSLPEKWTKKSCDANSLFKFVKILKWWRMDIILFNFSLKIFQLSLKTLFNLFTTIKINVGFIEQNIVFSQNLFIRWFSSTALLLQYHCKSKMLSNTLQSFTPQYAG